MNNPIVDAAQVKPDWLTDRLRESQHLAPEERVTSVRVEVLAAMNRLLLVALLLVPLTDLAAQDPPPTINRAWYDIGVGFSSIGPCG